MSTPLEDWFESMLRRVVREEMAAFCHPSDDWRDQRQSPVLGPRRHCAAVRRRLQINPSDPCAKILGERFLLTTDAIAEELERLGRRPEAGETERGLRKAPRTPAPAEASEEDEALARVRHRLQRVK